MVTDQLPCNSHNLIVKGVGGLDFSEHIGSLASLVGSLTVVGSALIWIYNKFIGAPREKKRILESTRRQKDMLDVVRAENAPLIKTLQELNQVLQISETDRQNLNRISLSQSKKLKTHHDEIESLGDRVLVLEVRTGVKKFHNEEVTT